MTNPPPEHLPKGVLHKLLPAAFEPWESSGMDPSRPPTAESIERIESSLQIKLPRLFIEVAASCSSYGGWLNIIGDDYGSHAHIFAMNAGFIELRMPARYVLFNHGHDGDCDDCDAWDTEGPPSEGELPIVYFHYDQDDRTLSGLKVLASTFAA